MSLEKHPEPQQNPTQEERRVVEEVEDVELEARLEDVEKIRMFTRAPVDSLIAGLKEDPSRALVAGIERKGTFLTLAKHIDTHPQIQASLVEAIEDAETAPRLVESLNGFHPLRKRRLGNLMTSEGGLKVIEKAGQTQQGASTIRNVSNALAGVETYLLLGAKKALKLLDIHARSKISQEKETAKQLMGFVTGAKTTHLEQGDGFIHVDKMREMLSSGNRDLVFELLSESHSNRGKNNVFLEAVRDTRTREALTQTMVANPHFTAMAFMDVLAEDKGHDMLVNSLTDVAGNQVIRGLVRGSPRSREAIYLIKNLAATDKIKHPGTTVLATALAKAPLKMVGTEIAGRMALRRWKMNPPGEVLPLDDLDAAAAQIEEIRAWKQKHVA